MIPDREAERVELLYETLLVLGRRKPLDTDTARAMVEMSREIRLSQDSAARLDLAKRDQSLQEAEASADILLDTGEESGAESLAVGLALESEV